MKKLRIYLADLIHTGMGVASSDAFPLNIGLVASYALKNFGSEVEILLFKHPEDLLQAMRDSPPYILGCSNYAWNYNLSNYFTQLAKALNSECITVWGGTNFPFSETKQEEFLRKLPMLDMHVFYEGEQAFSNILNRFFSKRSLKKLIQEPLDGVRFISPEDGTFVYGQELPRIKNLDSIPSPYVTGLLDKFFDGFQTPLVETARGCPFACNFCNAGDDYFNKVNKFSDEYVREELTYIAKMSAKHGVSNLTLADNNFGMIPRDAITTGLIRGLQNNYGWPKSMIVFTGKNSKKRVISATRLLGDTLNISVSVQSMDKEVLKNIKRDNICLEDLSAIAKSLQEEERPQLADTIVLLPGETAKSFLTSIGTLLDLGVTSIQCHTLTMLYGTPYRDDPNYVRDQGYVSKYRIVVRQFSELEGKKIFDVEKVATSTKDMSFEDYVEVRIFFLIVELCHNSRIFKPLQTYIHQNGIKNSEWVQMIYDNQSSFSEEIKKVFQSFAEETASELWESEDALIAHYSKPESYQMLLEGEQGGNVLYRHRVWVLAKLNEAWINTVFDLTEEMITSCKKVDKLSLEMELKALRDFILKSNSDCFSYETLDKLLVGKFEYDIPAWLSDPKKPDLKKYKLPTQISIQFHLSNRDVGILRDAFARYGTSVTGIVRLLQQQVGKMPLRSAIYSKDLSDQSSKVFTSTT